MAVWGNRRSRNLMVEEPVLFRARMVRTDPLGTEYAWFEGPYPKAHKAQARITFWKKQYAEDPERRGWKVRGEIQSAEMRWSAHR